MNAERELSELVRSWTGTVSWPVFQHVEAGLRRERERLARKPSLLVVFREATHFGAPSERFDLIQDRPIALGAAEVAEIARAHIARWRRPGWGQSEMTERHLDRLRKPSEEITRTDYAGFRAESPDGKEWVAIHVESLRVWADITFGPALLSYLSRQGALVAYLRDRGHRPLATSASRESSNAPCPRCWGELAGRNVGLKQIWSCGRCGGVWLPPEAARAILEHDDGSLRLVVASEKAARVASEPEEGPDTLPRNTCPWDGQRLVQTSADGIFVDSCAVHGTWFDAHEVHHIANAHTRRGPAPRPTGWGPSGGGVSTSGAYDPSFDVFDAVWDAIFRPGR